MRCPVHSVAPLCYLVQCMMVHYVAHLPDTRLRSSLPRGALRSPDDMRRVHAWLEAEHAKGAKSVRAPELYAPTLNDCAGIGPAEDGSGLLDFEAEAVRDL